MRFALFDQGSHTYQIMDSVSLSTFNIHNRTLCQESSVSLVAEDMLDIDYSIDITSLINFWAKNDTSRTVTVMKPVKCFTSGSFFAGALTS